jgi:8-oxo-dGTP diphosphatase
MKIPRVGVQVVVNAPKRPALVLLGKRRGGYGDGEWALPGGHLEFKESFEDAAKRELLEETGLQAFELGYWDSYNTVDNSAGTHYVQIAVRVQGFTGKPKVMEPDRCSALDWFDVGSLPTPIFAPSQRFLERLVSDVQSAPRHSDRTLDLLLCRVEEDAERESRRYVIYHFSREPAALVVRLGRIGETVDRQVRRYPDSSSYDLTRALRTDIGRRLKHGYQLHALISGMPFDEVADLVPEWHPEVNSLAAEMEGELTRLLRSGPSQEQWSLFSVAEKDEDDTPGQQVGRSSPVE